VPNSNNGEEKFYMIRSDVHLQTRAHNYKMPEFDEKGKESSNATPPLQIEKIVGETMTCIPKGVFKKDSGNLNARDAQNYTIVEDLAQTPYVMYALEVLQSCPS
jgi:hypothetical protein